MVIYHSSWIRFQLAVVRSLLLTSDLFLLRFILCRKAEGENGSLTCTILFKFNVKLVDHIVHNMLKNHCDTLRSLEMTRVFSRGLRDSMGHCVRPSVRPSVFSHFGGDSCITAPAQLIATAFVVFFVRPSVRRSVRPSVRNPLLCERFLHLRSCPIARDWCCCVYGTPHCPCPTHYCPCPTPATNAAVYPALLLNPFSFCSCLNEGVSNSTVQNRKK